MTARVLFGQRGSNLGLFVSHDGQDVLTADEADLLINMSANAAQLLLVGLVTSLPDDVVLNLTANPVVLLYNVNVDNDVGVPLFARPFPETGFTTYNAQAQVASDFSEMTISGGVDADNICYMVLREGI